MLVFAGIIIGSAVLGLIVFGLHKYQSMEVEYTVDRTMPLPPLGDGVSSPNLSTASRNADEPVDNRNANPSNTLQQSPHAKKSNWQDLVTTAKESNDFERALSICQENFPLWSAYNQYCIALRSQLKSTGEVEAKERTIIEKLYRAAATAELLHDKSEGATRYTLNQLRSMPLNELADIPMPYDAIGYAQLRLIRKSDVKLMLAHWGRPDCHLAPREHHHDWWETFSQNRTA